MYLLLHVIQNYEHLIAKKLVKKLYIYIDLFLMILIQIELQLMQLNPFIF